MRPAQLPRLLRTVRHLRAVQVLHLLRRPFRGPWRRRPAPGPAPGLRVSGAAAAFLPPAAHVRASTAARVELIGRDVAFPGGIDWGHAGEGPLWQFHLHYHEWVRAGGLAPAERAAVLLDWIARHREGVGWGPAPSSLRIPQWVKLLLTDGALALDPGPARAVLASLADQLETLAGNLELDLLGNHYLMNLLTLVLGGALLEGAGADRWLGFEGALRRELELQVGADGAHQERSPMYHALVLEAVLDLVNVARATPGRLAPQTEAGLRAAASRMLRALACFTHPDGEIALFGDSALGIAASPAELRGYARRLGIVDPGDAAPARLEQAGFVRLERGGFVVIVSVGGPAPDHQPGHAHCDALAFECSVDGRRVVTDSGVAEYRAGARRVHSRATAAHATLEVGGHEQAELWAEHRVGGRPRVALVSAGDDALEATCAGWATPGVVQRRSFALDDAGLTIRDRIEGPRLPLRATLPLAPGLEPLLDGTRATLAGPGGSALVLELPDALDWSVESGPYYPTFGREVTRAVLVGRGRAGGLAFRLARAGRGS